jgi:cytochrome P450
MNEGPQNAVAQTDRLDGIPELRPRIAFNPFSPAFRQNPYATYEQLRENSPFLKIMGSWFFSRHQDIISVLRDRRFSSSRIPEQIRRGGRGLREAESYHDYKAIESFVAKAIVFTESPDHARLRRLVNTTFDATALAVEQPMIERVARQLLLEPVARGEMELIADFADKLPMYVMCERLGVPREMGTVLRDWAHEARLLLDPTLMSKRDYLRVEGIMREALEYFEGVIAARRSRPGRDVVSTLLASRHKDDQLTDQEVALTCIMSFVAGHETTKYLIGNATLALLHHPSAAEEICANPELASQAVDEILRYDAPLQQTKRVATADIEFGEITVREGEQVILLLGSADRDPAVFEQPDSFWICRPNSRMHLGFGYGMRSCLGGALAHLEATVAVKSLFNRQIEPSLATDTLEWQSESVILRGLRALPVTLTRRM